MTSEPRGASVSVSKRPPSIDLVTLVELLAQAIPPDPTATGPRAWPLFSYDTQDQRLRVNTRGLLSRLWGLEAFAKAFRSGEDAGFIRDATLPPKGVDAQVGGRVVLERAQDLTHAVAVFRKGLDEALSAFCAEVSLDLATLVSPDSATYLQALATRLGQRLNTDLLKSDIVPIQFADPVERPAADKDHDVARLIAAVETVDSQGWLEHFEGPARRKLARPGNLDEEEIDAILDNFRRDAERPDSETQRFFNFLDDEALGRVRLEVAFAIMRAIRQAASQRAGDNHQLLVRFVDNIEKLRERYLDTEESFAFDASGPFSTLGQIPLSDYLRKVRFYRCLAVWPEPEAQLFEFRPAKGGSLVREVSYRFRVNGNNPEQGQSAFKTRIAGYQELLEEGPGDSHHLARHCLAELAFLSLVVPRQEHLANPVDVLNEAERLRAFLQKPGDPLKSLIGMLASKSEVMDQIRRALVEVLRTHGQAILGQAEQQIEELSLCVREDIIDWERLATATGNSRQFLVRPGAGQNERSCWFQHVVVTRNLSTVPDSLFSVKIHTQLRERVLTRQDAGDEYRLQMRRVFDQPVLPVLFQPCHWGPDADGQGRWRPVRPLAQWQVQAGINFEIEERTLANHGKTGDQDHPEHAQQSHAATVAAFAVLVHTLLWLIRERLATGLNGVHPRLLILRAQQEGRNAAARADAQTGLTNAGSEALYAISQAIELALGCEGPVFMQGWGLDDIGYSGKFRERGSFAALASAFPLAVRCPEALRVQPVALINYTTRRCSAHPGFAGEDAFLYTAKTYVAEPLREGRPGYVLREDRTQLHIQPESAFKEPTLIFEEIGRLRDLGCRHVMLLWQHYGNRRIGRTADRHAPHSSSEFLEGVAERFPDLTIYPLSRDVFPAMRLMGRPAWGRAFEAARMREHEEFWLPAQRDYCRELIPVYTLATLTVVGNTETEMDRPQSGFCTYFLEWDSRLSQREWAERARANLTDPNQNAAIRPVLISVLRGVHYLHAEQGVRHGLIKPKLDPHQWIAPATIAGAGELKVMGARHKGSIILSFPAVLAQISTILRGNHP